MARLFANQTTDQVAWSGGPLLYDQTAASIMCWFKRAAASTSGAFHDIFWQEGDFNIQVAIEIMSTNDADNGKLTVTWRTPGQYTNFISTTAWDDDAWHRLLVVRRNASPYTQLYVDGVSDGSQTTDPLTDSTAATGQVWGNSVSIADSSFGGTLARCGFLAGTTLTPAEADVFFFQGQPPLDISQHLELWGASTTEPDYSGAGLSGTVTGTSKSDHPSQAKWRRRAVRPISKSDSVVASPYYMNYYKRIVLGTAA